MSGQRHVNLDQALRWLEGDERMLESIRVIFLKNIPDQVARLGASLDRGDTGSAQRMARTIKGSAAIMGAVALSSHAERIEQSALDRDLHKARLQFPAIAAEYEKVMLVLRAFGEPA